jgi:putative transposase
MAAGPSIDVSGWLEEQLAQASPDLLRAMVTTFAEALMSGSVKANPPWSHRGGRRC